MRIRRLLIIMACVLTSSCMPSLIKAQNALTSESDMLVLPPLFEYPTAPEDIETWTERSNWLVEHFWDNFDFKQKSVGQAQLNHAFTTYIVPMRFASLNAIQKSQKKLLGNLSKNPTLLVQFVKAAERNIYNPSTSEILIDDVYLDFLNALLSNKKVQKIYKAKYEGQQKALANSLIGKPMPRFNFLDRHGVKTEYSPEAITTIIEFGDPDCAECRITRVKLEMDSYLQQLAKDGKLRIYFITPDVPAEDMQAWERQVADYPHYWTVGASESLEESIDLRTTPCIYLIDSSRNIVSKNASIDYIIEYMQEQGL